MEKVWLKNYQEGVPHEINPDDYPSLVTILEECSHKYGPKPAFSNMGNQITFSEFAKYAHCLAGYLQQHLQLHKGERVAIMMPNLLQYPVAMYGVLLAGLCVVNVNPLYTAAEVTHQLNDCGAETIIVMANFAHTIAAALPQLHLKHIIVTEAADLFPAYTRYAINFVIKYLKQMIPAYNIPNTIKFNSALKLGKKATLNPVTLHGNDLAFLQYTGGTTGIAKGAMLSHRNMVANALQAYHWVKPITCSGKEIVITAIPLYHIFSLTANCLLFILLGSLNILITNPKDIVGFIKQIATTKFTVITGVSTLYNALLCNPNFVSKVDLSCMKIALSGGMALQPAVAEHWKQLTQKSITEAYGLTETSPAITINPMHHHEYNHSIGLPISSTDISIRDNEGQETGFNQSGILWVKGPQVMLGYWNQPDETTNVLGDDGWLNTGDIAKIDENGYIYIVDRAKDMINVSGFNVYPNEVEQAIARHPDVLEVGVIGVPCERSGEQVKACIVKKNNVLNADDIIKHCHEYLAAYKIPKLIEFVDELPKTNVGKILRRKLR